MPGRPGPRPHSAGPAPVDTQARSAASAPGTSRARTAGEAFPAGVHRHHRVGVGLPGGDLAVPERRLRRGADLDAVAEHPVAHQPGGVGGALPREADPALVGDDPRAAGGRRRGGVVRHHVVQVQELVGPARRRRVERREVEAVGAVGVHLRQRDAAVVVDRLDVGDVATLEPRDRAVPRRAVRLDAHALGDLGPVDRVAPVPAGVPVGEADAVALAQPERHPGGALALEEAAVVADAVGAQRGLVAVGGLGEAVAVARRARGGCRASPSAWASRSASGSRSASATGSADGVGGWGVGCGCGGAVGVGSPPPHGPPGSADATAENGQGKTHDDAQDGQHPGGSCRSAPRGRDQGHAPQGGDGGPVADGNAQTGPERPMVGYNRGSR